MVDRAQGGWRFEIVVGSLLALVVCRALANVVLWRTGFSAISDDDFARVVIAQRFADNPNFDPSGTSWLPLPFWLMGGAMAAFGTSLAVAKGCAFMLSLVSSYLHFVAARWLGLAPAPAFYGCLAAALLLHSLALSLATIPEGYTAALCLLGIVALNDLTLRRRTLGALALLAACLCRYEAWPLAAAFSGLTLFDIYRRRLPRIGLFVPALAVLGMLVWLVHGAIAHHNALFFLTRVAAYRQALLGDSSPPASWFFPALLLREPALIAALICGLAFASGWQSLIQRYRRPAVMGLLLLVFLSVGHALGGAATHHPERSLLVLWLLAALCAGDLWHRILTQPGPRRLVAASTFTLAALVITFIRSPLIDEGRYVDRRVEIAIGLQAHRQIEAEPGPVAVDTVDYGYFAVIAALGLPHLAHPVQTHDPRDAPVTHGPSRLEELGARWLVADKSRPLATSPGAVRAENQSFVLLDLAHRTD